MQQSVSELRRLSAMGYRMGQAGAAVEAPDEDELEMPQTLAGLRQATFNGTLVQCG
jgi:hypothetical protein